MKKILFFILLAAFLTGCASGSSIVTGKVRPETDPATVKLYLKEPLRYEVLGIVEASSRSGLVYGAQRKQNQAVEKLKEQAAELGANGVLLTNAGEKTRGVGIFGGGGGVIWAKPQTSKTISGEAIFVYEE